MTGESQENRSAAAPAAWVPGAARRPALARVQMPGQPVGEGVAGQMRQGRGSGRGRIHRVGMGLALEAEQPRPSCLRAHLDCPHAPYRGLCTGQPHRLVVLL
ncbi:hypothetical protein RGQ21_00210 [Kitasatospora aureofaciens]|nr:hypothetical protein RGQ21_00210 [Kitasatospora aureofaciens]